MKCKICKKELEKDEIGIYRRLVYREAEDCLCIPCFAKDIKTTEEELKRKVEHFKAMGCTLFQ